MDTMYDKVDGELDGAEDTRVKEDKNTEHIAPTEEHEKLDTNDKLVSLYDLYDASYGVGHCK